jgi:DNA repair photolyase
VDAFVFWTRDPRPFGPVLDRLERQGWPYVVLFTLTGYGPPLEPRAPSTREAVAAFRELASRIGPRRVTWRYDPIIYGPGLDPAAHGQRFAELAQALAGATDTVKLSFMDLYRKTVRRLGTLAEGARYVVDPTDSPALPQLVEDLRRVADDHGMRLETCAEDRDFSELGVPPGACIDGARLSELCGIEIPALKDRGQRRHCGCAPSRDIGMNDSCLHGCVYCYATASDEAAQRNWARHDPDGESLLPLPPMR